MRHLSHQSGKTLASDSPQGSTLVALAEALQRLDQLQTNLDSQLKEQKAQRTRNVTLLSRISALERSHANPSVTAKPPSPKLTVSPGYRLLQGIFHPDQYRVACTLIGFLSNRDQLNLAAAASRSLRPLVESTYRFDISYEHTQPTKHPGLNRVASSGSKPVRSIRLDWGQSGFQTRLKDERRCFTDRWMFDLDSVSIRMDTLVDWPQIAAFIAALPSPPRKMSVNCSPDSNSEEYMSVYRQGDFSDDVRRVLCRVRSLSLKVWYKSRLTKGLWQILDLFTGIQRLTLAYGEIGHTFSRELVSRLSHLTYLKLVPSNWNLQILLNPENPCFRRLVTLSLNCTNDPQFCRSVATMNPDHYPHLVHLELKSSLINPNESNWPAEHLTTFLSKTWSCIKTLALYEWQFSDTTGALIVHSFPRLRRIAIHGCTLMAANCATIITRRPSLAEADLNFYDPTALKKFTRFNLTSSTVIYFRLRGKTDWPIVKAIASGLPNLRFFFSSCEPDAVRSNLRQHFPQIQYFCK
ncbi:hypothetical protein H4R33_002462 [Dimargaris cristalligena]|uniref:Uncharacterized protein n=1 Tax=Dimargaris cristalligena TaxID=215637 RepID=A0A4P9ZSK7_9FUNG|nr:hypothetical protein H4R33_002462 [Dimargaris cristalligena]RKP35460.1 hypothetical protein BJ085DRAFT_35323 [Dimargaris cristalligena]|eukprot:RKP35460.1 hypothetical protein BJ085DRAFT_35323 [Dimargaris cristalligena]